MSFNQLAEGKIREGIAAGEFDVRHLKHRHAPTITDAAMIRKQLYSFCREPFGLNGIDASDKAFRL